MRLYNGDSVSVFANSREHLGGVVQGFLGKSVVRADMDEFKVGFKKLTINNL